MVKSVVDQYKDLYYKKALDYQPDKSHVLSKRLKNRLTKIFFEEINEQKPRGHRVYELMAYEQKQQAFLNDCVNLILDKTYGKKEIIKFFLDKQVSNFTIFKVLRIIEHVRKRINETNNR